MVKLTLTLCRNIIITDSMKNSTRNFLKWFAQGKTVESYKLTYYIYIVHNNLSSFMIQYGRKWKYFNPVEATTDMSSCTGAGNIPIWVQQTITMTQCTHKVHRLGTSHLGPAYNRVKVQCTGAGNIP